MKLTINDKTFEVDMAPLEQRAREQIEKLMDGGGAGTDTLRMMVKQACNIALPFLHIQKATRNDDPIRLVIDKLSTMIFSGLEQAGVTLTGQEVRRADSEDEGRAL